MFALSGNACYSPRIAALDAVQGDFCVFDAGQWLEKRYDDPRYKVPECMIIWGYNIPATCPDNLFGHWIIDLMKKGTKIIAIDPRLSFFASRAKHWLQVRPGADAALAMGFLRVVLDEKLYDRSWVKRWTNGPHLIREDTGTAFARVGYKSNRFGNKLSGLGQAEKSTGDLGHQDCGLLGNEPGLCPFRPV